MLLQLFLGASITISVVQYLIGSGQPNPDPYCILGSRTSITAQGKKCYQYPLTMDLRIYRPASGAVTLRRHLDDALRVEAGTVATEDTFLGCLSESKTLE